MKKSIFLLTLILVGWLPMSGFASALELTFKANTTNTDASVSLSTTASISDIFSNGAGYVESITEINKCFLASNTLKNGIKVGSSTSTGSLSLLLKETYSIRAIVVTAAPYSDSEGQKGFIINGHQVAMPNSKAKQYQEYVITLDNVDINSITLASCERRIYVKSISLVLEDNHTFLITARVNGWHNNVYVYSWNAPDKYDGLFLPMIYNADGYWAFVYDVNLSTYPEMGFLFVNGNEWNQGQTEDLQLTGSACYKIVGSGTSIVPAHVIDCEQIAGDQIQVNVPTAGTFATELLKQTTIWTSVTKLTITGHLNEYDLSFLSRFSNLINLNIEGTDITSFGGCKGLTYLRTVSLPPTVQQLKNSAFSGCKELSMINLDNVTHIGDSAFYECKALQSVSMPQVQTIGDHAFDYCDALQSVSMPQVQTIGNDAFYSCDALQSVSMPQVQTIGSSAFYSCNALQSVSMPQVQTIGSYAFYYCDALQSVSMPQVQTIGSYAFYSCNALQSVSMPQVQTIGGRAFNFCKALQSVILSDELSFLGSNAFSACSALQSVYCPIVIPLKTTDTWRQDEVSNAILYVPACSILSYMTHSDWSGFGDIVPINDYAAKNLFVVNDFELITTAGLADTFNITLRKGAKLDINVGQDVHIGHIYQHTIVPSSSYDYDSISSILPNCNTTVDSVTIALGMKPNCWNFISFPFDVRVSDIVAPAGAEWVIRKYSGADRAALTGNTWQNMSEDMMLNAYEGYILQYKLSSSWSNNSFIFKAVNNNHKDNIMAFEDVAIPLAEYPSDYAHNRSWNLVGNPYPIYYDIQHLGFTAPITRWNGSGYSAFSPLDDALILRPYEAFFVQKPQDATNLIFTAIGRQHHNDVVSVPSRYRISANRQVYDFTLSDNAHSDRTRLVLNEAAKMEYEMECDAAKFMSMDSNIPQIFIHEIGMHWAINERPVDNGQTMLGIYVGSEGEYTLNLSGHFSEPIWLLDLHTNQVINLAEQDYIFYANAGMDESRFIVSLSSPSTDLRQVHHNDEEGMIYSIDGRYVMHGAMQDNVNHLPQGVYLIRHNGQTYKMLVP